MADFYQIFLHIKQISALPDRDTIDSITTKFFRYLLSLACSPPKKVKKAQIYSLTSSSLSSTLHLTSSFLMMDPGFINCDDTRKSGSLEIHTKFSEHIKWWYSISSAWRKWGTYVEQTCFISSTFVKMHQIDILEMCRSSASFRMDEWQSFSITADTVLMLTSVATDLSLPLTCSISADFLLSANVWTIQSFILESLFHQSGCFHFQFF